MEQRQDSLNDQMLDVLALTHAKGNRNAAIWLQHHFFDSPLEITPDFLREERLTQLRDTVHVAIANGCYDAADWLGRHTILNTTLCRQISGIYMNHAPQERLLIA